MGRTRFDIIIVGGGIVGLSCAFHLQRHGLRIAIIDPGNEEARASFGNAGVISRNSIFPMSSPAIWPRLLRYASGVDVSLCIRAASLHALAPWLLRFLSVAHESAWRRAARALNRLTEAAFASHMEIAEPAGVRHLFRRNGWMRLYRSEASFAVSAPEREILLEHGVRAEPLVANQIREIEPSLKDRFTGGLLFPDSASVDSPGDIMRAYEKAVRERGGMFVAGKASRLAQTGSGVQMAVGQEILNCDTAVIAAGAWSAKLAAHLGYRIPLVAERGYHVHRRLLDGVELNRPVHDSAGGYVILPMKGGVRILTGVELARPDDPPNYGQISAVVQDASRTLLLDAAGDERVWMGSRPSTPDGLPIIGFAPRHDCILFAFGHGHIGFSTGPVTGHLISTLVSRGTVPFPIDDFSPRRFGRVACL